MDEYWIVLTIGFVASTTQIITSFFKLKSVDGDLKNIKNITVPGVMFYFCTVVLAILPTCQHAIHQEYENKKEADAVLEQEKRDKLLKERYDASLLDMFDTTTTILSANLAEYDLRLDSSDLIIKSLRDSLKTKIIKGLDPVLGLYNWPKEAIIPVEQNGNFYKFKINTVSNDAGSAFFKTQLSIVISDSLNRLYYIKKLFDFIEPTSRLSTQSIVGNYIQFNAPVTPSMLILWHRGSYKRIDGTGNLTLDDVYYYNLKSQTHGSVLGGWRSNVISFVNSKE